MARLLQPRRSQLPGGGGRSLLPPGSLPGSDAGLHAPHPSGNPSRSPLLTAPQSRPHEFRRVHRSDPRAQAPGRGRGRSSPLTGRKPALCALPALAGPCLWSRGAAALALGYSAPSLDSWARWAEGVGPVGCLSPWTGRRRDVPDGGGSWRRGSWESPGVGCPGRRGVLGWGLSWSRAHPGGGVSWGWGVLGLMREEHRKQT